MRHLNSILLPALALVALVVAPGCDGGAETGDDVPINDEYGKPTLEPAAELGKADSFDGNSGPRASGISTTTEVWEVTRRWYEEDAAAGMAWEADSGLTWDEKYAAWIDALKPMMIENSWGGEKRSFEMMTPWGKTLQSPTLECAEVAIFMRATFASWYNLPFFMSAGSGSNRVHFGHFGIVQDSGARKPGYPKFRSQYRDYTSEFAGKDNASIIAAWPVDTSLHGRSLTSLRDDKNEFLGADAYAGDYFDEIYLNKRVGHWMVRLLVNFGSMHLAGGDNTFNLKPRAVRPGDVQLERWQRRGIGHTLVVKRVEWITEDRVEVDAMYGSMPRIQPEWYTAERSKNYFITAKTGGPGENFDGEEYAVLGGGTKRWRTPVVKGDRWLNIVPVADREQYIDSADKGAIAARTGEYEDLLGDLTPDEERDVILSRIEEARTKLEQFPASCSNRERREEAFNELYVLNAERFSQDKFATDAKYRELSDYVFAELVYDRSMVCCWLKSTSAMYQIIMSYNEQRVLDDSEQTCNEPVVFKAVDGDFQVFKDYALEIGALDQWVEYTNDENCDAGNADNTTDVEAETNWTPLCEIRTEVLTNSDLIDAE